MYIITFLNSAQKMVRIPGNNLLFCGIHGNPQGIGGSVKYWTCHFSLFQISFTISLFHFSLLSQISFRHHLSLFHISLCHFSSNFFSLQSQISSLSHISCYLMHHFFLVPHFTLPLFHTSTFPIVLLFHCSTFPCSSLPLFLIVLCTTFPCSTFIYYITSPLFLVVRCLSFPSFTTFPYSTFDFSTLPLYLLTYFSFVQLFPVQVCHFSLIFFPSKINLL